MLAYVSWDPSREAFSVPFFHFPVYWYSIWFALGFYGAVLIFQWLITRRARLLGDDISASRLEISHFVEQVSIYSFIGVLVGARLGHVLFYDVSYYMSNPVEIVKVWHGGLASHGAVIGLLIALWIFNRKPRASPALPQGYDLLDAMAISSAWMAFCIRVGNFWNQEIVGNPTSVPWAILFGSPQDGIGSLPRHPVQLYEALTALILLVIMLFWSRNGRWAVHGQCAGWYLGILFSFRIFFEYFKVPQSAFDTGSFHMGQLLSLPVIMFAVFLIIRGHAATTRERNGPPHGRSEKSTHQRVDKRL
jgi:prolipoprotein diacylglyceryl transferase